MSARPAARRAAVAATVLAGLLGLGAGPAAPAAPAAATWRLEQPAPPEGSRFRVPLGRPGDLQCLAVDRCLLAVEGNATIPAGLFFYDGVSWRQHTTVCGGPGDTTRIAWASPDEYWTVTTPSAPRQGGGLALCRIKGGQVVGSFSTADQSPDPFRTMTAAACRTPDDCWFGGIGAQDPSGQRIGAFHLHWDGQALSTVYGPQGRGVSDLVAAEGGLFETTFMGAGREDRTTPVSLAEPEPAPVPVHAITGTGITNARFTPRPQPGVPVQGTELLGADAAGSELWFVGGGAASGPDAPADGAVPRPPIAVRRTGDFLAELPLDERPFGPQDRFVDVGVLPGTSSAMVAVQPYADRGSSTAEATVARVGADGTVEPVTLPASGAGRGAAAKVDCPAPDECWMVTTAGWLFHLTDGAPRAASTDPAFAQRIDFRPNEASAQFVPDTPPADDSQLFAPPPTELPPAAAPPVVEAPRAIPALIHRITKPKVSKGLVLTISFTLRRRGRVQLQARRGGRVVAKSSAKVMRPGRKTVRLKLTRKRYPTALRFLTAEGSGKLSSGRPDAGAPVGTGDDSVTTTTTGPADPAATTTTTTGPGSETTGTRAAP